MISPAAQQETFQVEGPEIGHVASLVFLGIYAVTSGMTLAARTVKATDSFFAHFKLMRESGVSHQLGWPPR